MANIKKQLSKLWFIDAVCLLYCIFMLIIISLFGGRLPDQLIILSTYSGCVAGIILCIFLRRFDNPIFKYLTSIYPLILLIPFYEIAGRQVHLFFNGFFDNYLLAIENAIFPAHPVIWFERFYHPLITEWMMMGYSLYLFLMPIILSWLYFTNKKKESQFMLSSLLLSLFFCYIMFSIFPVAGPRLIMTDLFGPPLEGYIFRAFTSQLEATAMLYGGAFPSAHCAAATVMLVLTYRYDRKLFYWILPILITLYISTVYGRYHYPIDVLVGIIVGIACIKLTHPARRLWGKITGA